MNICVIDFIFIIIAAINIIMTMYGGANKTSQICGWLCAIIYALKVSL